MAADRWSSGAGFVLATMGSAIGLGSIWKFPYEAGVNGGGSFILPYLAGLALIVVPLLLAEFAIGRAGRGDAIASIGLLADRAQRSRSWRMVGALGVLTGFLILSFYAVIGGWALSHACDALLGGALPSDAPAAQARFEAFLAAPNRMFAFHLAFMAATALVVAGGIESGIETASRILMPLLLALICALAIFSLATGDAKAALRFLFEIDPTRLRPRAWLDAMGLGFFSIGVGMGSMITYAAYAGAQTNLGKVALVTVVGDTAVSILAGLAIFPIVFQFGLDPASGPGLMFVTLPLAFAHMPFGNIVGFVFYILLVVSALASAISLLELTVAPLIARGLTRLHATALAAFVCALAGVPSVLSFNLWRGSGIFDGLDTLTSDVMLPLAGLGLALFAGYVLPKGLLGAELAMSGAMLGLLRLLLRAIAPALIAAAVLGAWI